MAGIEGVGRAGCSFLYAGKLLKVGRIWRYADRDGLCRDRRWVKEDNIGTRNLDFFLDLLGLTPYGSSLTGCCVRQILDGDGWRILVYTIGNTAQAHLRCIRFTRQGVGDAPEGNPGVTLRKSVQLDERCPDRKVEYQVGERVEQEQSKVDTILVTFEGRVNKGCIQSLRKLFKINIGTPW